MSVYVAGVDIQTHCTYVYAYMFVAVTEGYTETQVSRLVAETTTTDGPPRRGAETGQTEDHGWGQVRLKIERSLREGKASKEKRAAKKKKKKKETECRRELAYRAVIGYEGGRKRRHLQDMQLISTDSHG